jgi:hypothetical protein
MYSTANVANVSCGASIFIFECARCRPVARSTRAEGQPGCPASEGNADSAKSRAFRIYEYTPQRFGWRELYSFGYNRHLRLDAADYGGVLLDLKIWWLNLSVE